MGKLIDITSELKSRNNKKKSVSGQSAQVVDMTEPRQEILDAERRDLKRTILTEFVGAFVVVPNRGLMKVALFDISDNGVAFEVETHQGGFSKDEKLAMRIYLNHKTFFEFVIQVKWFETHDQFGIIRHGSKFVKNTLNDVALHHFVRFIEAVSVNLKADEGDLQIPSNS